MVFILELNSVIEAYNVLISASCLSTSATTSSVLNAWGF